MKYTLNFDKIELKFTTEFFILFGYVNGDVLFDNSVSLAPCYDKTELNLAYSGTAKILYDGKHVGYIHYLPDAHDTFLPEEIVHIRFINEVLYDVEGDNICNTVITTAELGLQAGKISKCEIAYDSNEDIMEKFFLLEQQEAHVLSKKITYEHKKQPYKKLVLGKFTIYDKTAEIEASQKLYIRRYHIANGINPDEVCRVELRLDNTAALKCGAIDVSQLFTPFYKTKLFGEFQSRYLFFRKGKGRNYSRNPKIYLLEFSMTEATEAVKVPITRSDKISVTAAKRFAKSAYFIKKHLADNGGSYPEQLFKKLLDHYELSPWFELRKSFWDKFYIDRVKPIL